MLPFFIDLISYNVIKGKVCVCVSVCDCILFECVLWYVYMYVIVSGAVLCEM